MAKRQAPLVELDEPQIEIDSVSNMTLDVPRTLKRARISSIIAPQGTLSPRRANRPTSRFTTPRLSQMSRRADVENTPPAVHMWKNR
ncbi:hypothetical protein EWM64_g2984 [Hericium alpestre]|uniref:Uncharacterized protein n=1 Tax=Hericium alpestre TaxID=135208 RepID=A0A4Z0A458_9AGAM|nr:hypothetical protein EWM64_g2984 [Hericium alpestre]